jgi:hypothetical protein
VALVALLGAPADFAAEVDDFAEAVVHLEAPQAEQQAEKCSDMGHNHHRLRRHPGILEQVGGPGVVVVQLEEHP